MREQKNKRTLRLKMRVFAAQGGWGVDSSARRPGSAVIRTDTIDIRIMLALMSPNPSESESRRPIPASFIVRFNWSA
jgi:hypothetical protein